MNKKDNMVCSLSLCATEKQNIWHVDSGFSKDMRGDPNKFMSLKKKLKRKVTFGDDLSSTIIGKGKISIRNKMKENNVLLVNKLKPNILRVRKTCDQGHICMFDSNQSQQELNTKSDDIRHIVRMCQTVMMKSTEPFKLF